MGRLAGFRYREVAARLRRLGFELKHTSSGSHELWISYSAQRTLTLVFQRGDIPEGTLRSILRKADIDEDDFLA